MNEKDSPFYRRAALMVRMIPLAAFLLLSVVEGFDRGRLSGFTASLD
jgi:hypothetical protein